MSNREGCPAEVSLYRKGSISVLELACFLCRILKNSVTQLHINLYNTANIHSLLIERTKYAEIKLTSQSVLKEDFMFIGIWQGVL